ncbi:MAG: type I-E CRISPR-associated protein Cse1/CasA [Oscillospiraceae bacterium]|jgi:CRISPR system Cascade subunit CasA|nr:type I-E CRISPR-associated protein Cse1/CasA [Oscillospiraceae bacterium]
MDDAKDEKKFNLLDDSWILVTYTNGKNDTLSLQDTLFRAHEIKALSGELPTQDAAILRLLLAVLYAVFTRVDETGTELDDEYDAVTLWKRLWDLRRFPKEVIGSYLDCYRERFWLIHPERPFWQVVFDKNNPPTNKDGKGYKPTEMPAVRFIGDIETSGNLFCGRTENYWVELPEAARWLVHLNSFGPAPAGAPGKPPVTVKKGYGIPWPAKIGMTWISGDDFFETLMLNLVLEHNQKIWEDSPAWWEKEPPCLTVEDLGRNELPLPKGIVELMSMQYRYVKLQVNNDCVIGFELWSGAWFDIVQAFTEKMTPWKKNDEGDYIPRRFGTSKQLWRDFTALMPQSGDASPGVVKWANRLKRKSATLPFLRINTIGITYKPMNANVEEIFSDSLSINADMLSDLGDAWVTRITGFLTTTEKMVNALGQIALDIAKAIGGSENLNDKRNAAREEAYFVLDMPFRNWLVDIDPAIHDLDSTCEIWENTAHRIILQLGEELVTSAGVVAFIGRREGTKSLTASTAHIKFKNTVAKILRENKAGAENKVNA